MIEVSLWRSGLAILVPVFYGLPAPCCCQPSVLTVQLCLEAGSGLTPLPTLLPLIRHSCLGTTSLKAKVQLWELARLQPYWFQPDTGLCFLIRQINVVLYETLNSHWFYSELNNQALCKPPGHLCTSKNLFPLRLWLKITFSEVFSCVMR